MTATATTGLKDEVVLRPSALPILSQCPKFISSGPKDFTEAGTQRHKAIEAILRDDNQAPLAELSSEDREGCQWAVDYIRMHAPMHDYPLYTEREMVLLDDDFNRVFPGRIDYSCGPHLFDIKSRERNYDAQLCAYALMLMQECGWDKVYVHALFTVTQRAHKFEVEEVGAMNLVTNIIKSVRDPEARPRPCDYCGWCARQLTCPEYVERVNAVVEGREDWKLENYHSSQIETPEGLAKALTLARTLKGWCEAVDYQAKDKAIKEGWQLPGYKLQDRAGRREIADIGAAFTAAALPQEEFLRACQVSFTSLVEVWMSMHGMKKAPAEREVQRRLGDIIQRRPSSTSLVKERAKKAKQEEEETV